MQPLHSLVWSYLPADRHSPRGEERSCRRSPYLNMHILVCSKFARSHERTVSATRLKSPVSSQFVVRLFLPLRKSVVTFFLDCVLSVLLFRPTFDVPRAFGDAPLDGRVRRAFSAHSFLFWLRSSPTYLPFIRESICKSRQKILTSRGL